MSDAAGTGASGLPSPGLSMSLPGPVWMLGMASKPLSLSPSPCGHPAPAPAPPVWLLRLLSLHGAVLLSADHVATTESAATFYLLGESPWPTLLSGSLTGCPGALVSPFKVKMRLIWRSE